MCVKSLGSFDSLRSKTPFRYQTISPILNAHYLY